VSLYNETNGVAIPPTPAIGGVGLVPDLALMTSIALKAEGNLLVVIGREDGHLGQSLYQLITTGRNEGAPPPVDLADEIKAGNLVRALIRERKVSAVHDVTDGGLLVAIAEMALAGDTGVQLFPYEGRLPAHAAWFGEDQGRYVLTVKSDVSEAIMARARAAAIPVRRLGLTGGDALTLPGERPILVAKLRERFEGWLPAYMAGAAA
jgi:phosphoribosylformylglycinamidine synthase subunit PurL